MPFSRSRHAQRWQAAKSGARIDAGDFVKQLAAEPRVPLRRDELARLVSSTAGFAGTAESQTTNLVKTARAVVSRHHDAAAQDVCMRV